MWEITQGTMTILLYEAKTFQIHLWIMTTVQNMGWAMGDWLKLINFTYNVLPIAQPKFTKKIYAYS